MRKERRRRTKGVRRVGEGRKEQELAHRYQWDCANAGGNGGNHAMGCFVLSPRNSDGTAPTRHLIRCEGPCEHCHLCRVVIVFQRRRMWSHAAASCSSCRLPTVSTPSHHRFTNENEQKLPKTLLLSDQTPRFLGELCCWWFASFTASTQTGDDDDAKWRAKWHPKG